MSDTLEIFGTEYTNVTGIRATDDNGDIQTYIRPQGTKSISANGTGIDVSSYASVDVAVPSGSTPSLQTKTKSYTPTETAQSETITADNGYDGLSSVEVSVGAISSTYVGSGITQCDDSDMYVEDSWVMVSSGSYFPNETWKSVGQGAVMTPDTTISTSPSITVGDDGLITVSVSTSQQVTPSVTTRGYVSNESGMTPVGTVTAGTITVSGSNTSQLSTQAATTITPTTSSQTAVTAGKYTTGAVTVNPIPSNYITTTDATATASDIVSGETAYVNGSKVTGTLTFVTYYTGTTVPSTLADGDIFLKVVS